MGHFGAFGKIIAVPPEPPCQHEYVHLDTTKKAGSNGWGEGYNIKYVRIDRFYCKKCLKEEVKVKEECSREPPSWW